MVAHDNRLPVCKNNVTRLSDCFMFSFSESFLHKDLVYILWHGKLLDVFSLSIFDFEHHGNSKYGSPFHTSKDRRSSQGKMEKSFIRCYQPSVHAYLNLYYLVTHLWLESKLHSFIIDLQY